MKELIIMAGLPGAGKSYIRNKYYNKFNVVDCDEIKKKLPNYDPEQPRALHQESKIVEEYEIDHNLKEGNSFVYDTTATNIDKIVKLIQHAQELQYRVTIVYVKVSLATAMMRNSKRDRVVPVDVILDKYSKLNESINMFNIYANQLITIDNE